MKNKQLSRSSQRVRLVPLVAVASLLVVGKSSADAYAYGKLTLDWGSLKINDTPVDLFGIDFDINPGGARIEGSLGRTGPFGDSRTGLGPVQASALSEEGVFTWEEGSGEFQDSNNKLSVTSRINPSIGDASARVGAFSFIWESSPGGGAVGFQPTATFGTTPLGQPGRVSIDYQVLQRIERDVLDESASNSLGFKIVITNIGGLDINDKHVVETWTADFSSAAELTGNQMVYSNPDNLKTKNKDFDYENFTSADNPWVPYFTTLSVYAYSDSDGRGTVDLPDGGSTGLLLSAVLSGGLLSRLSLRRLNRRRRSVLALG